MDERAGGGGAGDVNECVLAPVEVVGEEEHAVVAELGMVEGAPAVVLVLPRAFDELPVGCFEGGVERFEPGWQGIVHDDVVAVGGRRDAQRHADEVARVQADVRFAGTDGLPNRVSAFVESFDPAFDAQSLAGGRQGLLAEGFEEE